METPIYLFTGFLEAGKTRLIQETMEDPEFNAGESTLILLTEEGEEELDPAAFAHGAENIFLRTVETPEELTPALLEAWRRELKFRRILIEYNGMWMIGDLYRKLTREFPVYQEIMVADAATFPAYNANMRSLAVDKLQGCELVIFNRMTEKTDKMQLHKIVRGISRAVNISYEYTDGRIEYDDIVDPLPFDLEAPIVEVADRDFALLYRDMTEDIEKYDGKVLRYRALIARDERLEKDAFVGGRQIMTCCADDIAYQGFICRMPGETVLFSTGDWVLLTARVSLEKHKLYRSRGPVLYVQEAEKTNAPEEPVASFY